jgi:hypothetical protein
VIRLDQGAGRARRPILTARKVHFEIDLLVGSDLAYDGKTVIAGPPALKEVGLAEIILSTKDRSASLGTRIVSM